MIWAQVCTLHAFPVTLNLLQNSDLLFPQHLSPSFTIALHCHCWNKIYRVVRSFLQIIIKRIKLIGLKGLAYSITNILILYATYYIFHMYSDTPLFFFPCLDRNKYQPMLQTTFITTWIQNLLSGKKIF